MRNVIDILVVLGSDGEDTETGVEVAAGSGGKVFVAGVGED